MEKLEQSIREAIWVAHSLFQRGKTAGSSANLSFRYQDRIYITASGSCFGTLTENDFAVTDEAGARHGGKKPSKELELHRIFYEKNPQISAVIHTHSFYSVLLSCLEPDEEAPVPQYTPYLRMKVGRIGVVPYGPPGSPELFEAFRKTADDRRGYLLKNHGLLVGGSDIMEAFYGVEELEESAKTAWFLRGENAKLLQ